MLLNHSRDVADCCLVLWQSRKHMSPEMVDTDSAASTSSSSMDQGKRTAPPGGDFDGPHGTAALVKDAYGASWLLQVSLKPSQEARSQELHCCCRAATA